MKNILLLTLFSLLVNSGYSQAILTKEQALQILLEKNYNVKLSQNDIRVAENNTSIYNSGLLPKVSGSAGANYNLNSQRIEAHDGTVTNINNAQSQSYNASLGVNYTVFNGYKRKYVNEQLQEKLSLSELDAQATLENAILDVFTIYLQTAKLTENMNVLEEVLQVSKQRVQRATYQYDYGQSNKLAILNAQVDVNNDSISLINTKQILDNTKQNLLLLIGETEAKQFDVVTDVEFVDIPDLEILLADLPKNISIKQIEKSMEISDYATKITKSDYMPTVGVFSSYGLNYNNYPTTSLSAGLLSYGLNAGLSVSWNIFDGGGTKTRIQNAIINQENQVIFKERLQHQLNNAVINTYRDYQNKRFVLRTQEKNLRTTEQNYNRTEELFKIGRVSSVEYRLSQLNLLNSQTAILTAKYDAKIVELELLQLTGRLMESVK